MNDFLLVASGLVLLVAGGEFLVRGAVSVAERLGMSQLLIGITIVGFGTSAPELATSIQASLAGAPGIAIGNIVGSNIANILLILGTAALIAPIAMNNASLGNDAMVVLASTIAFCVVSLFWPLDRLVGATFLLGLATYLFVSYRNEKGSANTDPAATYSTPQPTGGSGGEPLLATPNATGAGTAAATTAATLHIPILLTLTGFVTIFFGGKLLVDGASGIARSAGISEAVIGLTVVAIGTSLPELVTSVIAALRRHTDMALGNILGSNIYNILAIGGVTALVAPTTVPAEIIRFDNAVMMAVTVVLLAMIWRGVAITKPQGGLLLACYPVYLYSLWPG